MNLYKISQDENNDYDTYDSAVVAAPNEESARDVDPSSGANVDWVKAANRWSDWAFKRESVKVEYIGEAKEGTAQGVICASFNAG